ncbi:MAG: FAD-dependent oxidoreductase, partial [Kiritimatiellia bacterium]
MKRYDVLVVGAGPAGTVAALAAARGGCSVLLVEKNGFCGGMATAGLVNPFLGSYYRNPETGQAGDLIAGLYAEICARLRERGALLRFRYSDRTNAPFSDAFDDAWLRIIYDQMLSEAAVDVMYHATLLDAQMSGGRIASIRVLTKGGILKLTATSFVDSTGDADLAAASGVQCEVGRPGDGLCQPCSTMFRMGGVNKALLFNGGGLRAVRERVNTRLREAVERGVLEFRKNINIYDFPRPGVLHFNATRVAGRPALSAEELSRVEIEGRRQVAVLADWLRAGVPGFEKSFLESVASHVGVRETRRVVGKHVLTREEVVGSARFSDGIARSAYFIDIHAPLPTESDAHADRNGGVREDFKPRTFYEIPLRCLQPLRPCNLLVACRAISTDHYAHGATRVMGTMMAVGEAAGRTVALAKKRGIEVGEVDGAEVRAQIGYLDEPLGF